MPFILIPFFTVAAFMVGWTAKWLKARIKLIVSEKIAKKKTKEILLEAERLSELALAEEKTIQDEERKLSAEEQKQMRDEVKRLEEQLAQKQHLTNERDISINKMKSLLMNKEHSIREREQKYRIFKEDVRRKLEAKSDVSLQSLKEQLVQGFANDEKRDAQHVIQRAESEAERSAAAKAREMLVSAMQRLPLPQTIEYNPTNLETPNQEMISRLISREGRYIRFLENLLKVKLCVEEAPEDFTLSSPDPVNREIAKVTLERLFKNGRINPTKIEESFHEVTREINETMETESRNLLRELKIDDFKEEAVTALGRLIYRYSYGQNQFYHAKEVALLAALLAIELDVDPKIALRAGLLHDIGKGFASDEKAHGELGAELAECWGEDPNVINAIASHHNDTEQTSVEAVLVQIADAISGARPGARRETISNYLERVENLEHIAEDFEGVDRAFAIYAGRELRILASIDRVNDEKAAELASNIARKVEESLSYPGKIKITVIREMKVSTYTR